MYREYSFENVSDTFKIISTDTSKGGRSLEVEGTLREPCNYCASPFCAFDCDESSSMPDPEEDQARHDRNNAFLGIESLLVALVSRGVDLGHSYFRYAVEDAIDRVKRKLKT